MKKITKVLVLEIILFVIVLSIGIGVRCYNFGEVPRGLHVDEAGMAYDAFSLANFKVDRHLKHLPVYLINFGGGQSALYAYLAAIIIKFLGITTIAIRLPALLCSAFSIIAVYFIARKPFGKKIAMILMFLWVINPWNIMASRWGLDCNLLGPVSIISLWLLFKADKWYDYIVAGIGIGLVLYTYAISYIIMPVFLILIILYMLYTKRITFKNTIIFGLPILILALPLILMVIINTFDLPEISFLITIPKLGFYRGSEVGIGNVLDNISKIPMIFSEDGLSYNSIGKYGTVYYISIPFVIVGLVIEIINLIKNIKAKKFAVNSGIFIFLIATFIGFLMTSSPCINKVNAMYFPLIFLVISTIRFLQEKVNKKLFYIILTLIIILYGVSFASFVNYYFNIYSVEFKYQNYFEDDLTNAIAIVNSKPELNSKKVNIMTWLVESYVYTLLVNQPSPYDFFETRQEDRSWGRYVFNKEEIHEDWIYIIKDNGDYIYTLTTNYGFKCDYVGTYAILYK